MKNHTGNLKKRLIEILLWIPLDRLLNMIESIRIERLKRKFGALGKRVAIDQNFYVAVPENLFIEDNVSFARDVRIMGGGTVHIKNGTMIAPGVTILTTTHDARALTMRETGFHSDVSIGCNVWIGACATILPDVSIGDNSIVGAGTVVVEDVENGDVLVGAPPRIVRNRLTDLDT